MTELMTHDEVFVKLINKWCKDCQIPPSETLVRALTEMIAGHQPLVVQASFAKYCREACECVRLQQLPVN